MGNIYSSQINDYHYPSSDTTVVANKTYYTMSGGTTTPFSFTKVSKPSGNPSANGYYELRSSRTPNKLYWMEKAANGKASFYTIKNKNKKAYIDAITKSSSQISGKVWVVKKATSVKKKAYQGYKSGTYKTYLNPSWEVQGDYEIQRQYKWKRFKWTKGKGKKKKYYIKEYKTYHGYYRRAITQRYNFVANDIQPMEMNITYQDIDVADGNTGAEVGRNTSGYIARNRKRTSVVTIEVKFPPLTSLMAKTLLQYLEDSGGHGFMQLCYSDPHSGKARTIYCYCGDRTIESYNDGLWQGLKVTFVQV